MKKILFILLFAVVSTAIFAQSKKWTVECHSCELKEVKSCQSCANPVWTMNYVDGVTIGGVFMQYPFKSLQANKNNKTIRIVDFNNLDKTFNLRFTSYSSIESFMDAIVSCINKCDAGSGSVSIVTDNGDGTFSHDDGNGNIVTVNMSDADADPTNELITSTLVRNDSVFVVENGVEHFTGINSGLPDVCPAGSLLLYNGTIWTCFDTINLVTTNTILLTVNAGTTAASGDDSNGTADLQVGDNLHFYSSDGSIDFNVSEGSAVVDAIVANGDTTYTLSIGDPFPVNCNQNDRLIKQGATCDSTFICDGGTWVFWSENTKVNHGNVAYVGTTGNDASGRLGSDEKIYATITAALAVADNVVVFAGNYNEDITLIGNKTLEIKLGATLNGTATLNGDGNIINSEGKISATNNYAVINNGENEIRGKYTAIGSPVINTSVSGLQINNTRLITDLSNFALDHTILGIITIVSDSETNWTGAVDVEAVGGVMGNAFDRSIFYN